MIGQRSVLSEGGFREVERLLLFYRDEGFDGAAETAKIAEK